MEPGSLVRALLLSPPADPDSELDDDDPLDYEEVEADANEESPGQEDNAEQQDVQNDAAMRPKITTQRSGDVVVVDLTTAEEEDTEGGKQPPAAVDIELKLSYAKMRLRDQDLLEFSWPKESYSYREVDFSQNEITAKGLQPILDLCARCRGLQVLKLFKNSLDDAAAEALACLFNCCQRLREVHLSHNRMTTSGVVVLVSAAQRWRPENIEPLWLRVESNSFTQAPKDLLDDLVRDFGVCYRKPLCSQFRCVIGSKVHLPFLDTERERREKQYSLPSMPIRSTRSLSPPGREFLERRNGHHSRHAKESSSRSRSRPPPEPMRRERRTVQLRKRGLQRRPLEDELHDRDRWNSQSRDRRGIRQRERRHHHDDHGTQRRPASPSPLPAPARRRRRTRVVEPLCGMRPARHLSPTPPALEFDARRKRRRIYDDIPRPSIAPLQDGYEAPPARPSAFRGAPEENLQGRIDLLLGKLI